MPTNLHLDDRLIETARRLGRHRSKRDAVNAALEDYVRHLQQLEILDLVGTIDYDPAHDYKAGRRRRHHRMPG